MAVAASQKAMVEVRQAYDGLFSDTRGFEILSALLRERAGVNLPLNEKNRALMAGRLAKVMARHQCTTYAELAAAIEKGNAEAATDFLSAMTTHTTHFFREAAHFALLRQVFPKYVEQLRTPEVRVWCAASSTGEEVWSIATTLLEAAREARVRPEIQILATDIDKHALVRAAHGIYPIASANDLPPEIRQRYFINGITSGHPSLRVRREVRNLVTFAEFNLQTQNYAFKKQFDFVFCRNVLIYFCREDIERIVKNLESVIAPGGYLFVGHSEAILGATGPKMTRVEAATYQKSAG